MLLDDIDITVVPALALNSRKPASSRQHAFTIQCLRSMQVLLKLGLASLQQDFENRHCQQSVHKYKYYVVEHAVLL